MQISKLETQQVQLEETVASEQAAKLELQNQGRSLEDQATAITVEVAGLKTHLDRAEASLKSHQIKVADALCASLNWKNTWDGDATAAPEGVQLAQGQGEEGADVSALPNELHDKMGRLVDELLKQFQNSSATIEASNATAAESTEAHARLKSELAEAHDTITSTTENIKLVFSEHFGLGDDVLSEGLNASAKPRARLEHLLSALKEKVAGQAGKIKTLSATVDVTEKERDTLIKQVGEANQAFDKTKMSDDGVCGACSTNTIAHASTLKDNAALKENKQVQQGKLDEQQEQLDAANAIGAASEQLAQDQATQLTELGDKAKLLQEQLESLQCTAAELRTSDAAQKTAFEEEQDKSWKLQSELSDLKGKCAMLEDQKRATVAEKEAECGTRDSTLAEKATEFTELTQAHNALLQASKSNAAQATADIVACQSELASVKATLDSSTAVLQGLQSKVATKLSVSNKKANWDGDAATAPEKHRSSQDANALHDKVGRLVHVLLQDHASLGERLSAKESEIAALTTEFTATSEKISGETQKQGKQLEDLHNTIQELRRAVEGKDAELVCHTGTIQEMEAELARGAELVATQSEREAALAATEQKFAELQSNITKMISDAKSSADNALKEENNQLQRQLEVYELEMASLKDGLASEKVKLELDYQTVKAALKAKTARLKELTESGKMNVAAVDLNKTLASDKVQLEARIKELEDEAAGQSVAVTDLQAQVVKAGEDAVREMKAAESAVTADAHKLADGLETARTELAKVMTERQELHSTLKELRKELEMATDNLEQTNQDKEDQKTTALERRGLLVDSINSLTEQLNQVLGLEDLKLKRAIIENPVDRHANPAREWRKHCSDLESMIVNEIQEKINTINQIEPRIKKVKEAGEKEAQRIKDHYVEQCELLKQKIARSAHTVSEYNSNLNELETVKAHLSKADRRMKEVQDAANLKSDKIEEQRRKIIELKESNRCAAQALMSLWDGNIWGLWTGFLFLLLCLPCHSFLAFATLAVHASMVYCTACRRTHFLKETARSLFRILLYLQGARNPCQAAGPADLCQVKC